MVLEMGEHAPLTELSTPYFLETTERYKGQAVIDDHGVVTLQDGSPWPGGMPFVDPKTGREVMGYARFLHAYDDFTIVNPTYYVNKEGKHYKTAVIRIFRLWLQGRLKVPPIGKVPGSGPELQRQMQVFTTPRELKGLGFFRINHIDDTETYDTGFSYLPAFKRTVRISSTTFQDNVGGSDFTYGDPTALNEPYGQWNFKLIEKKHLLTCEPVRKKQPILTAGGLDVDIQATWDEGKRFPRLGWAISPVYVIEATAKERGHLYSKKIIYVCAPYYANGNPSPNALADIYDRPGQLWKEFVDARGRQFVHEDGTKYTATICQSMYDIQAGHQTHMVSSGTFDDGMPLEFINLKQLLRLGR
jgi:hypothetical protein